MNVIQGYFMAVYQIYVVEENYYTQSTIHESQKALQ